MMLALPFALVCISDRRMRCYGLRVVLPVLLCPVQVFVDRFEKTVNREECNHRCGWYVNQLVIAYRLTAALSVGF